MTFKILALTGMIVFLANSCTEDQGPGTDIVKTTIENNMGSGTWIISSFIDSGNDETAHFSDFEFTFDPEGDLIATGSAVTYTGTWSIKDNNSNDDSPDDLDFNIYFSLTNEFEDLNDDWDIVSQGELKIELVDISGGNGGTDSLTFVRK